MTETDWLAGTEGDEMLALVADRLTPRQWAFLAAAHVNALLFRTTVNQQLLDLKREMQDSLNA